MGLWRRLDYGTEWRVHQFFCDSLVSSSTVEVEVKYKFGYPQLNLFAFSDRNSPFGSWKLIKLHKYIWVLTDVAVLAGISMRGDTAFLPPLRAMKPNAEGTEDGCFIPAVDYSLNFCVVDASKRTTPDIWSLSIDVINTEWGTGTVAWTWQTSLLSSVWSSE